MDEEKRKSRVRNITAHHGCFADVTFCRRWFLALNSSSSLISYKGNVEVEGYSNIAKNLNQSHLVQSHQLWVSRKAFKRTCLEDHLLQALSVYNIRTTFVSYLVKVLKLLNCSWLCLDWGKRSENYNQVHQSNTGFLSISHTCLYVDKNNMMSCFTLSTAVVVCFSLKLEQMQKPRSCTLYCSVTLAVSLSSSHSFWFFLNVSK